MVVNPDPAAFLALTAVLAAVAALALTGAVLSTAGAAGTGPATGTVELTRPVYPYPEEVRYSGSGSTTEASSFTGFLPAKQFSDDIQWAGFPFTSGYEKWCDLDGSGKNLVCVRKGEQGS